MKEQIKSAFKQIRRSLYSRDLFTHYPDELLKSHTDSKVGQLLLQQHYKSLARHPGSSLPTFKDVGFRQYSQFEEDGILLYLFSLITPQNRICVEICAGDGMECNSANLIINHGWWGHLFDGNPDNVRSGKAFYGRQKDTAFYPPKFTQAWITAENINQLLSDSGLQGKIDLLSLDMDGVDYWIWKAIDVVEPTVVVCEIHNPIPPDLALTIPYASDFGITSFDDGFRGASLRAMVHLARSKGYRLAGTHRLGFNAFFVKNGVVDDLLPEMSPEECADDPYTQEMQATEWPKLKDKNWVKV